MNTAGCPLKTGLDTCTLGERGKLALGDQVGLSRERGAERVSSPSIREKTTAVPSRGAPIGSQNRPPGYKPWPTTQDTQCTEALQECCGPWLMALVFREILLSSSRSFMPGTSPTCTLLHPLTEGGHSPAAPGSQPVSPTALAPASSAQLPRCRPSTCSQGWSGPPLLDHGITCLPTSVPMTCYKKRSTPSRREKMPMLGTPES